MARANELLSRYPTLDAPLAADARLLGSLRALRELPADATLERREAAVARRRWRLLEEGSADDGTFVAIGPAEANGHVDAGWLAELVDAEQAWLKRMGLEPVLVAEETAGDRVIGVVFEVEEPGLVHALAMEAGVHRRRGRDGEVERLLVEVLPLRAPARRWWPVPTILMGWPSATRAPARS